MIDHTGVLVSDFEKSKQFFDILPCLNAGDSYRV
jgi:catechol 2,3-dioxygenase-like lactoylglutathione lyase family enzyme